MEENHGEQAVITAPGVETFREFVLFAQNGVRLLDAEGALIKTNAQEDGAPADHEDTGEKGYNYCSERFFNRLARLPLLHRVFDSAVHGDPATPLLTAYAGEHVLIRLLMPADKPRNTVFLLHGHQWPAQTGDIFSNVIGSQGAIGVGGAYTIEPLSGASRHPGDYLYRFGVLRWDLESGMWGILSCA